MYLIRLIDSTIDTTAEVSYVFGSSAAYTFPGGPVTGRAICVMEEEQVHLLVQLH